MSTYVCEACCYGRSSVVCLSVCLSATIVSHAKTAEPIEMPLGLWTRVGPRNYVLDGGPDPHAKGNFEGGSNKRCLRFWLQTTFFHSQRMTIDIHV